VTASESVPPTDFDVQCQVWWLPTDPPVLSVLCIKESPDDFPPASLPEVRPLSQTSTSRPLDTDLRTSKKGRRLPGGLRESLKLESAD
jgi:hypothetical protein